MFSELLRPKARRVSSVAAREQRDGHINAPALSSSRWGSRLLVLVSASTTEVLVAGALIPSRRHWHATLQANSFDITSHKPSLPIIKHSSSGSLFVKVISGFDITYGFRYLSPAKLEQEKYEITSIFFHKWCSLIFKKVFKHNCTKEQINIFKVGVV